MSEVCLKPTSVLSNQIICRPRNWVWLSKSFITKYLSNKILNLSISLGFWGIIGKSSTKYTEILTFYGTRVMQPATRLIVNDLKWSDTVYNQNYVTSLSRYKCRFNLRALFVISLPINTFLEVSMNTARFNFSLRNTFWKSKAFLGHQFCRARFMMIITTVTSVTGE